jgi:hypothetical protein
VIRAAGGVGGWGAPGLDHCFIPYINPSEHHVIDHHTVGFVTLLGVPLIAPSFVSRAR